MNSLSTVLGVVATSLMGRTGFGDNQAWVWVLVALLSDL